MTQKHQTDDDRKEEHELEMLKQDYRGNEGYLYGCVVIMVMTLFFSLIGLFFVIIIINI